jgi:hypothetical protein
VHPLFGIEQRRPAVLALPRQVKVAGTLVQREPGARWFTLILPRARVPSVLDERVPLECLAEWLGKPVVVAGRAVFGPSGALLCLQAHRLEEPRKGAELWSRVPKPLFVRAEAANAHRVMQRPRRGLDAIIGHWPGDEDDHAVDEALEYLS